MGECYAIEMQNVAKSFRRYPDRGTQLRELVLFRHRSRYELYPVLRQLTLRVRPGEAVGLIGCNGCGKSTTLKLLSRILEPDAGTIILRGRVASLIELGAGFHPDLTGRENIRINAAIFGLTRAETDRRMDEIIRFSGIGQRINDPVRTYSSGMYMRLAFSVAIHVDADILLIDEILAVGDAAFQEQCYAQIRARKAAGTAIVIVSHDLGQIEALCDRCIWLRDGLIHAQGDPARLTQAYLAAVREAERSPYGA